MAAVDYLSYDIGHGGERFHGWFAARSSPICHEIIENHGDTLDNGHQHFNEFTTFDP